MSMQSFDAKNITEEQYLSALIEGDVLGKEGMKLFTIWVNQPGHIATATSLSKLLPTNGVAPINAIVGRIGNKISDFLNLNSTENTAHTKGWRVLATGEDKENFEWTLHGNLYKAIIKYKSNISRLHNSWGEFLKEWPLDRLSDMSINEYTDTNNDNTFTYWIERKLLDLGSIKGGSSFKFGIFKRDDKSSDSNKNNLMYTQEYVWYKKYGTTPEQAFESIKNIIVKVAVSAREGRYDDIDNFDLGDAVKWKVGFLYQSQDKPGIISIYKKENLQSACNLKREKSISSLHSRLISGLGDRDIFEYTHSVWSRSNGTIRDLTESRYKSDFSLILKDFVDQSKTKSQKTKTYPKTALELNLDVSFGQGNAARVPWLSLLGKNQKTSQGIYPVYLLYKEKSCLILSYGISETQTPEINWTDNSKTKISEYLDEKHAIKPSRYGNSMVFKVYDTNSMPEKEIINNDIKLITDEYKEIIGHMTIHPEESSKPQNDATINTNHPLNTILYGPPGTGKTYNLINKSLEIMDPAFLSNNINERSELTGRFKELLSSKAIRFITFHQSFGYEEFVEGINAETLDGKLSYDIKDGIFKLACNNSNKSTSKGSNTNVSLDGRKIWKMSLGDTQGDTDEIYDLCIENNEIRLGYGKDIDFSGCSTKDEIKNKFLACGKKSDSSDYDVTAVYKFKEELKIGDIVIISDGNLKFRAIAEIKGEYCHSTNSVSEHYVQTRSVIWHKVFENSLSHDQIISRRFSQQTIYQPSSKALLHKNLADLINKNTTKDTIDTNTPSVLIIDEINRGNISKIFGELITLIEPSKRLGADEAITVQLPYSKEPFGVPSNLYIIGTMNTADRSLAMMDTALRRRFDFIEMMPDPELLKNKEVKGINLTLLLNAINERIEHLYDREHTIGHAFLMPVRDESDGEKSFELLRSVFANKIIPLLEEYFFEDWSKIRLVLGDNQTKNPSLQFIHAHKQESKELDQLFGSDYSDNGYGDSPVKYIINKIQKMPVEAFIKIYDAKSIVKSEKLTKGSTPEESDAKIEQASEAAEA